MKGYQRSADASHAEADCEGVGTLTPWEALVVDAVGNVIDFWQFKRNQGRVWALLYLRGRAMSAMEIQQALGLSKGGVSMLVRELEQWDVIRRTRNPRDDVWSYAAETDLMKMIGRVISERENGLITAVRDDLEAALEMARKDNADPQVISRLRRMKTLADVMDKALRAFLSTARFDVVSAMSVLLEPNNDTEKR
jgi:DNA-binding transcriptional regulator GbsR (MarR family)